jgi:hypothetical protein
MSSRWKAVLALGAVGVLVVATVAVVGIALGGGSNSASKTTYQADVVRARDRVDFALERITRSRSPDELLSRLDEASSTLEDTARDLGGVSAPNGLDDENSRLVSTLHSFSAELEGTVRTLRDPSFTGALPGINGLSYPQWNQINTILAQLEAQGIHVQPLARH